MLLLLWCAAVVVTLTQSRVEYLSRDLGLVSLRTIFIYMTLGEYGCLLLYTDFSQQPLLMNQYDEGTMAVLTKIIRRALGLCYTMTDPLVVASLG